jgi:hypothetical protein
MNDEYFSMFINNRLNFNQQPSGKIEILYFIHICVCPFLTYFTYADLSFKFFRYKFFTQKLKVI